MSGTVADRKRLLTVTAGNLRNNHLYINGHFDFFPEDCFGPSAESNADRSPQIKIHLHGLNEVISTNIGRDAGSMAHG